MKTRIRDHHCLNAENGQEMIKPDYQFLGFVSVILLSACSSGWVHFNNTATPVESIRGLLAKPDGQAPFPAIVLLHTSGGLRDHVVYDWPRYFTKLGYVSLSVDTFGSRGYFENCVRRKNPLCNTRDHATRINDAFGALEYLAEQPFVDTGKIALMGFSLGALAVNELVGSRKTSRSGRNFKAAIAMYGGCTGFQNADKDMIPLAVILGEYERSAARCEFHEGNAPAEVYILPKAFHAFDQFGVGGTDQSGNVMGYSAEATKKAEEIVKLFLERHLRK